MKNILIPKFLFPCYYSGFLKAENGKDIGRKQDRLQTNRLHTYTDYPQVVLCLWLPIFLFRVHMTGREKIIWTEVRWQRPQKKNSCSQRITTYLAIVIVSPNVTNKFEQIFRTLGLCTILLSYERRQKVFFLKSRGILLFTS